MTSTSWDPDLVFKALADPTRRHLIDLLRERNAQTLWELCAGLDMARQSVTQHLDLLGRAGLVVVVRRGRERYHYLDPGPIHAIGERWISRFDRVRLRALDTIRQDAEDHPMDDRSTDLPSYVYVTYIHASAARVWEALTDADITAAYWGHANVSDWQVGSSWEHRRADDLEAVDIVGTVLEVDEPRRLVVTFEAPGDEPPPGGPSIVTFLLEPHAGIVRLTVTHEHLPSRGMFTGISRGWPAVLSNLKSLLETGTVLPTAPWDVPHVAEEADAPAEVGR